MKKHITAHVIFAAIAMASQQACALGFGRAVPDAVLGQPLQFTAPIHVEAGERFGADCVSADVYFGETRVNASEVQTRVERGSSDNDWLVRISTTAKIGEPIVEISVSAGCERRFERRFTAFADPPSVAWSRNAAAAASASTGGAAATPRAGGTTAAAAPTPPSMRPVVRKGPTLALANELNAKPAPRRADVAPAAAGNRKPAVARTPPAPVEAPPRLILDSGYARLKMDIDDPVIPPTSGASSAAASVALSDLGDPTTQQLRQLEKSLQQMRRDTQASREQSAKLQAELAAAQSRNDLLAWALGLLALAAAGAVVLALRMRRQARLAHSAWFNESQMVTQDPPAPAPVAAAPVTAPVPAPAFPVLDDTHEPAFEPHVEANDGGAVVDMSATLPLDRAAFNALLGQGEGATPRELSVEELLDLEQQADFFIALGQEDAAVDLLMSHLRSAGGQSPLPYTKLLEIYRRQGDRSAYERTRARFNRRFNAYAPDWDTGPTAGRSLEDYPETIAHIQAMWNSPIDAMAVLEAMLFKRDETSELFDLPAYRDVLLLYSLARDLWQLGGGLTGTQVDVLLPLDDAAAPAHAAPMLPPLEGLDLPMEGHEPTRFAVSDFDVPGGRREIDLEVPIAGEVIVGEGVHATLDAFHLAPAEPTRGPSAPDWEASADGDPGRPGKR